jgi:DNA-binding transcriptional LysR family regulator
MSELINPGRIDFATLRLFCAVGQAGSITRGAEACHLALSAASRRLSDFEATAGARLLERGAQGVSLTAAGHIAMQHAMRLFHGFERFSSELAEYSSGFRGQIRLWANMSALTEFLPEALASFTACHPDIRIDIEEQLSGDIVRALIDGVADVGVFADNIPADGLETTPFQTDQLVVLCPKSHPLGRTKRIGFRDCLQHHFVGLNRGSSLLELTSRAAERAGLPMRLRVQVRSFDAMCHMIAAGLGIGVVPLSACTPQVITLGLRVIHLTDPWAMRQLLLASRGGGELPAAAGLLLSHLKDLAGRLEVATPGTQGSAKATAAAGRKKRKIDRD